MKQTMKLLFGLSAPDLPQRQQHAIGELQTEWYGGPSGTITSEPITGQLMLVSGVPVIEVISSVTNESGANLLAVIEFSELCSVGEFTEVTSSLTIEDCGGAMEVEQLAHLVVEGPGTSLVAFSRRASIDGSAWIWIGGELDHDANWSDLAG